MKVFLAGTGTLKNYPEELRKSKYILESFASIKEWQIPILNECDDFLLDSGAFTFIQGTKQNVDWDEYIKKYAQFIIKHDVKHFFELDIDAIVGYEQVLKYRKELEEQTERRCIPVWHKGRGLSEYKKMCDEYDYVAIGGVAIKEILRSQYKVFPKMINEAHKRGAKVHGLGFTSTTYFDNVRFDTVDSTTWNVGGKFGNICVFDTSKLMYRIHKDGMRCVKADELMLHNWNQWVKFQKYAEEHL